MKTKMYIFNDYFFRLFHFRNIVYLSFKLFLVFSLFNFSVMFAQENQKESQEMLMKIQKEFNYTETTESSLKELKDFFGNDKNRLNEVLEMISEDGINKIYYLSSIEYLPIKTRIESFKDNPNLSNDEYAEMKKYFSFLTYHFRCISVFTKNNIK